ncbi:PREDICTED: uncharacterized protein LOC101293977 [Fragaria vesca subsp. vesca]|uniref:uncharacterized protein LOC101293977 n=1 Tax=Fragaria vesca subsp. vesca TaxID=101020 RepID=UPI0002C32911|nr:PREDICTED: uncharacterized protein LOC101293977 [Fragaria vesca subsp. vesca]
MATAPVKPPLHNFPLSFLKWGSKNHTNTNHRYRRPVSAEPEPSADDDRNDSESPPQHHRVGSRTARHRFSLASCSEKLPQRNEKASEESDDDVDDDAKAAAVAAVAAAEEAEVQKPWNLRPRRAPVTKANNNTGGEVHEAEGTKQSEQPAPKSMRLRGLAAAAEGPSMEKKKEKRKFWIALSKDEIEEDIFIMTGSRPARRPKKRPKNVQKQLDNCFPGLWLVGFTADAYRGSDSPTKK